MDVGKNKLYNLCPSVTVTDNGKGMAHNDIPNMLGKGLQSSTFRLNMSTHCGIHWVD